MSMASAIIIKQLSRFVKGLDPSKLKVSTFRGEGELVNLELDETVLMQIIDLPAWLVIERAVCNRVLVKIPWMNLQLKPISLYVDNIHLNMATCENLRDTSTTTSSENATSQRNYGLIERVIDGLFVRINCVDISFRSSGFSSSIDLTNIVIQSASPHFKPAADLRSTRIKDTARGHVLVFKLVTWETLRIVINAVESSSFSAPIRFLSNSSSVRITMKKRLSDCCLLTSKVKLILDELLWILNDTQIKAVICFWKTLSPLIEKASKRSQARSSEKPNVASSNSIDGSRPPRNQNEVTIGKVFERFDAVETSYHFICCSVDLHINEDQRVNMKTQLDGAAIQLTLHNFSIDHYPFHPVAHGNISNAMYYNVEFVDCDFEIEDTGQNFHHLENYSDVLESRNVWAHKLLLCFKERFQKYKVVRGILNADSDLFFRGRNQVIVEAQQTKRQQRVRLMSSCFHIQISSGTLNQVSTSQSDGTIKKMIYSDKKTFQFPAEVPAFVIHYTDYYYPCNYSLPAPDSNIFVKVNPIIFNVHFITLIWLTAFISRISEELNLQAISNDASDHDHIDAYIEFLMPKIIIPAENVSYPDSPSSLEVQISQICFSNVSSYYQSSKNPSLTNVLKDAQSAFLVNSQQFPNTDSTDLSSVIAQFNRITSFDPDAVITKSRISKDCLTRRSVDDLWTCEVEQIWIEYSYAHRLNTSFIEPLPLICWGVFSPPSASFPPDLLAGVGSEPTQMGSASILCHVSSPVTVFMSQAQLAFVQRLSEYVSKSIEELVDGLSQSNQSQRPQALTLSSLIICPQIDTCFVMPHLRLSSTLNENIDAISLSASSANLSSSPCMDPLSATVVVNEVNKSLLQLSSQEKQSTSTNSLTSNHTNTRNSSSMRLAPSSINADAASTAGSEFSIGSGYSSEDDFVRKFVAESALTENSSVRLEFESNTESEDPNFGKEDRSKEIIAIQVFRASNVEMSIQVIRDFEFKLTVPAIQNKHYANTSLSSFMDLYKNDFPRNSDLVLGALPIISLRLMGEGESAKVLYGEEAAANGFLQLFVTNLDMDLSSLVAGGLADVFANDVEPAKPLPLSVSIEKLNFTLNKEPARLPSLPVKVHMLHIQKSASGIVSVNQENKAVTVDSHVATKTTSNDDSSSINESLEKQLIALKGVEEENVMLRDSLQVYVSEMDRLRDENQALLMTLEHMQGEMLRRSSLVK